VGDEIGGMTDTRDTRQLVSLTWLQAETTRHGPGFVLLRDAQPI
jgi:hypothetical protein